MIEIGNQLFAQATFWQRVVEVFTTPSLQLFLLLGSLLLAISLLLLTMTRLGHARPITKCVVLSVIAHVLLLGYAYGTRLMFQVPVAKQDNAIQVQFDMSEDGPEQVPEPIDDSIIDEFSSDDIQFETEPLARPKQEVPFELQRVVDLKGLEPYEVPNSEINIALLEKQSPQFNIEQPTIHFEQQEWSDDPAPNPEEILFQRHGDAEDDFKIHEPQFEVDKNDLEPSPELENIEIKPEVLNDNSFVGTKDRAEQFVSELSVPDADKFISDEFAESTRLAGQTPTVELQEQIERKEVIQSRRLGDGLPVPSLYQLRSAPNRPLAIQQSGGSGETEAAVQSALLWLSKNQSNDGRWCPKESKAGVEEQVYGHDRGGCGIRAEMGITALASLAFLGAGHTHLEGDYRENVQMALEFLVRNQSSSGDLSGNAKLFARMYCHSMALLALSEALAITGDARLERVVRLGVDYSVQAQNKADGGWRYQPGDSGDMSQFGWQVMALNAAEKAGIQLEESTKQRMKKFLQSCSTGTYSGLASYRPNEGPSTSMTAESLLCRAFLGLATSRDQLAEAQDRILNEPPTPSKMNLYYWYYATLALHQWGGKPWQQWNQQMQRVLLSHQSHSGEEAGSWSPDGLWGGYGGRVYSTALATLSLEVYYRYGVANSVQHHAVGSKSNQVVAPISR